MDPAHRRRRLMPRKGQYDDNFEGPKPERRKPAGVGIWTLEGMHQGRAKRVRLDTSQYECRGLASQLMAALVSRQDAMGQSWSRVTALVGVVRAFCRWIDASVDGPARL